MNANELAEIQAFKTEELTMWERNHTATMLRQQQAEIDRLLTIAEDFQMLIVKQKAEIEALKQSKSNGNNKVNLELTDEKIIEVHINTPFIDGYLNKNLIDFARAILKKAGE
jgi:hypothetical protein